jgi:OFA family oxalate/formate antiporter-like MFS transporter
MLATSFLTPKMPWLIYITYGIIGGFGVGAAYNTILSAAQKWFPQNRGFATGVSACAFGFSTVVFAPLIELLVAEFGLNNTFMILAGAFALTVLALFHFIRTPDENVQAGSPAAALLEKKQFTTSETIKTKEFYFIAFSLMFATAAFFVLNPSFKELAPARGLSSSLGTILVMTTGIANALGRLVAPLISDKIGRERAVITVVGATAICALLLCFVQGFLFMIAVAIIALCFGGLPGLYPVLTADYFGIKNVGSNYGAVMAGFAVSALLFPFLISLIDNQTAKFVVLSLIAAAGVLLIILLIKAKKKE